MDFPVIAVYGPSKGPGRGTLVVRTPRGDDRYEAAGPVAIAERLFALADDKPVLAGDVCPEAEQHFLALGGYSINLNRLASLVMPWMQDCSLATAIEAAGIKMRENPVETALDLFTAIGDILDTVPPASLELARRFLSQAGDTLADITEQALRKRLPKGMSDTRAVSDFSTMFAGRDLHFQSPPKDESAAYLLDEETVGWHFSPGGPLAEVMEDYEERAGQTRMACLCAKALQEAAYLIVEAGTGVGKSLAYLYPAAMHALSQGKRVVVATNTKTLQGQLMGKDIPLLAETLPVPIRASMLKGRRNYMCIRKTVRLLVSRRNLSAEESFAMAALVLWAADTETGDISENTTFLSNAGPEFWLSLASTQEECMGRQCRWYKACFLRQNRARAHASNIVVVNYALLMASLEEEGEIVPPFDDVVLDEAQNLEDAASGSMSLLVAQWRLRRFLRSIGGQGGSGGLVQSLERSLASVTADEKEYRVYMGLLNEARGGLDDCREAGEMFFEAAGDLVEASEDSRVRYDAESRNPNLWEPLEEAKQRLVSAVAKVTLPLERLLEETQPAASRRRSTLYDDPEQVIDPADIEEPTFNESYRELLGQLDMAREFMHDVDFVITASEKNYVYWLERTSRDGIEFRATPVDISGLLFETLYSRKRSVIFTSATLAVDNRFDFFKARSGAGFLEDLRSERVDSPFDYGRQSRLMIPTYLPEPVVGSQDFPRSFASMVEESVRTTQGRAMVLFTSHRMLREVAEALRPRLEEEGLEVLQQQVDGPREALLARFRRNLHSVLLGTASFWEGVDVKGESLSLLVLAKLPFPVYTDPLIQARQDDEALKGNDPFIHYLLPLSVLRLRQGFGRLIRSGRDRGVVVVADKRLLTRRYGGTFLRSLPARHRAVNSQTELIRQLGRFFAGNIEGDEVEYYFDDEYEGDADF